MRKIVSLNDLFEAAKEIEHRAYDLYSIFARMFSDHPDVTRIFSELAEDEKTHALELEKARSGLSEAQLRQAADPVLVMKAQCLGGFSVEKTLGSIRNLDDAFEVTHELENSEVNQLFRLLATKAINKETRMRFVDSEISLHMSRLRGFTDLSLDRNARRKILPKK